MKVRYWNICKEFFKSKNMPFRIKEFKNFKAAQKFAQSCYDNPMKAIHIEDACIYKVKE